MSNTQKLYSVPEDSKFNGKEFISPDGTKVTPTPTKDEYHVCGKDIGACSRCHKAYPLPKAKDEHPKNCKCYMCYETEVVDFHTAPTPTLESKE